MRPTLLTLTTRRLWIAAFAVLGIAVAVCGSAWLLRVAAPRVSYQVDPGKLTLSIKVDVIPPYQGVDLPFLPLLELEEIPTIGEPDDPDPERGRALAEYNAAVRAQNAYYKALERKFKYTNSHPGEPVPDDPPPPPPLPSLPPDPSP